MQRAKRATAEDGDFLLDTMEGKSRDPDGRAGLEQEQDGLSVSVQTLPRDVTKLPRKQQLAHLAAEAPELQG